jgi:hypothetical protein
MGWGNVCEEYHQEIKCIVEDYSGGQAELDVVTKLQHDMEFLAKMAKRYITVYREHSEQCIPYLHAPTSLKAFCGARS